MLLFITFPFWGEGPEQLCPFLLRYIVPRRIVGVLITPFAALRSVVLGGSTKITPSQVILSERPMRDARKDH